MDPLSESTTLTVGLVVLLGGGIWWAATIHASVRRILEEVRGFRRDMYDHDKRLSALERGKVLPLGVSISGDPQ